MISAFAIEENGEERNLRFETGAHEALEVWGRARNRDAEAPNYALDETDTVFHVSGDGHLAEPRLQLDMRSHGLWIAPETAGTDAGVESGAWNVAQAYAPIFFAERGVEPIGEPAPNPTSPSRQSE